MKVEENLRVCFIKHNAKSKYSTGMNIGNHTKFFMIDDVCSYVGSQNLYDCDLAEWGVVIDDRAANAKITNDFWTPLWEASYTGEDCNVDEVMDGLKINRERPLFVSFRKSSAGTAATASLSVNTSPTRISVYTQPINSEFHDIEQFPTIEEE